MKANLVPIESIMDINDTSIIWYRIPGFPGYEITDINGSTLIRSFKQRKKYAFGTVVKPNNGFWTISNSNNQRVKISYNELWNLVKSNTLNTCYTYQVQDTSRNPRCGIDRDAVVEVGKVVQKPKLVTNEQVSFVDFSNIPDIPLE